MRKKNRLQRFALTLLSMLVASCLCVPDDIEDKIEDVTVAPLPPRAPVAMVASIEADTGPASNLAQGEPPAGGQSVAGATTTTVATATTIVPPLSTTTTTIAALALTVPTTSTTTTVASREIRPTQGTSTGATTTTLPALAVTVPGTSTTTTTLASTRSVATAGVLASSTTTTLPALVASAPAISTTTTTLAPARPAASTGSPASTLTVTTTTIALPAATGGIVAGQTPTRPAGTSEGWQQPQVAGSTPGLLTPAGMTTTTVAPRPQAALTVAPTTTTTIARAPAGGTAAAVAPAVPMTPAGTGSQAFLGGYFEVEGQRSGQATAVTGSTGAVDPSRSLNGSGTMAPIPTTTTTLAALRDTMPAASVAAISPDPGAVERPTTTTTLPAATGQPSVPTVAALATQTPQQPTTQTPTTSDSGSIRSVAPASTGSVTPQVPSQPVARISGEITPPSRLPPATPAAPAITEPIQAPGSQPATTQTVPVQQATVQPALPQPQQSQAQTTAVQPVATPPVVTPLAQALPAVPAPAQTQPPAALRFDMLVTPQPFSPDGDGVADHVTFKPTVSDPARVKDWSLAVYAQAEKQTSAAGQGSLFKEWKGTGEPPYSFTWDGMGYAGARVEPAMEYRWVFTVRDLAGREASLAGPMTVDVLVIKEAGRLRIRVPSIIFTPNRADFMDLPAADLSKNAAIIAKVAAILEKYPQHSIIVEGHGNNEGRMLGRSQARIDDEESKEVIPITRARADFVRSLLAVQGVDPRRMSAKGMGSALPLYDPKDTKRRSLNRRVEFILVP